MADQVNKAEFAVEDLGQIVKDLRVAKASVSHAAGCVVMAASNNHPLFQRLNALGQEINDLILATNPSITL